MIVQPGPAPTAAPAITKPHNQKPEHHYHHHHHAPYPILYPFALYPLAFYDYDPLALLSFRTNDETLQKSKKPQDKKSIRMKNMKAKVESKSIPKQMKKVDLFSLQPLRTSKTRIKPKKGRNRQNIKRKNRKKMQFKHQFNLPDKSSPVLVSSSDLKRGVDFSFKGKSYKLTLRQMKKLLRKRNLLKKRKTKPKLKQQTFHQQYSGKKVGAFRGAGLKGS